MNLNYIPFLKFNQFKEESTPNHNYTGSDFFTINKGFYIYDSYKKTPNYNPRNISVFNQIIPDNINHFDNRKIYNNNIFIKNYEFYPQSNYLYAFNNMNFVDKNYQKYPINIKNDNNLRQKIINKKNNSQNKFNFDKYKIVQIYTPPLELTPINENKKIKTIKKRKPPKYYRKKKIYSLENKNSQNKIKSKLFDLDFNELEKISKKLEGKENENNLFLKAIKSSNSKNKNRINESKEKFDNFEINIQKLKVEQNYSQNLTKGKNQKDDESNVNSSFMKTHTINDNININNISYNNKKYMKKRKIDNKEIKKKEINNNKLCQDIKKTFQIIQRFTIENKEEVNKSKNKIFIKINGDIMKKENNCKGIKIMQNNEENKAIDNNYYKEEKGKKGIIRTSNQLDSKNKEKVMKITLLNKNNNNIKKDETKADLNKSKYFQKEEYKEKGNVITQKIDIRNSLKPIITNQNKNKKKIAVSEKTKIKKNEIKKDINYIKLNIEVDKRQLSSNKRTYLVNKIDSESWQGKNNNNINLFKANSKLTKDNAFSFSVEKNKGEKPKTNNSERKNNEYIINSKTENNPDKIKYNQDLMISKNDFSFQIKKLNNINNIMEQCAMSSKKERKNIKRYKFKNVIILRKDNSNFDNIIKNRDKSFFVSTLKKSKFNYINYNYNTTNIDKKRNIITKLKKEYLNNPKNNTNINKDIKKENNFKIIINSTNKVNYRANHNYTNLKSLDSKEFNSFVDYNPIKSENSQNRRNNININYQDNNFNNEKNNFIISSLYKNETSNRLKNKRLTNDINNCNLIVNNSLNGSNIVYNNSINNYQVLREPSIKSVDISIQNNNDSQGKRKIKINKAQNINHLMKISYGTNNFKIQNEQKENEIKNNNNKNKEEIAIINSSNNKNRHNNNLIINNNIKINTSINNEIKVNTNSFIIIDKNKRETLTKSNHSLYVSISSKK